MLNSTRIQPTVAMYIVFNIRYTYYFRTIPGFEKYVKPLDDILTYGFIPTLFGSPVAEKAPKDLATSTKITGNLTEIIKAQGDNVPGDSGHIMSLLKQLNEIEYKKKVESIKRQRSGLAYC